MAAARNDFITLGGGGINGGPQIGAFNCPNDTRQVARTASGVAREPRSRVVARTFTKRTSTHADFHGAFA